MNVEVERANRPVFCDAKHDIGRNGVTKTRTYIHLAIGRRFIGETQGPNSKPLICGRDNAMCESFFAALECELLDR